LPVLLCLALFPSVEASSMWTKTIESASDIVKVSDGYAIFGSINSDFSLLKIDTQGQIQWSQSYGDPSLIEDAVAIATTADGGFLLIGLVHTPNPDPWRPPPLNSSDYWQAVSLIKTDQYGNFQWNKTYADSFIVVLVSLIITPDGGYMLLGTDNLALGYDDAGIWLIKTDADGNLEWSRTLDGIRNDNVGGIVASSDGGYAITGSWKNDGFLIKIDAQGNVQWNKTYGGIYQETLITILLTSDGGYAMAGAVQPPYERPDKSADCWLLKTDANGNVQLNKTYGVENVGEVARDLITTPDGGFALTSGTHTPEDSDYYETFFWLVKTDGSGNLQWEQKYKNIGYEFPFGLVEGVDGGYLIFGYTYGSETSNYIWLVKTDEFGVVPEHPSLLTLTLVIAATLPLLLYKKRLFSRRTKPNLSQSWGG
jgi:hypothetical protein